MTVENQIKTRIKVIKVHRQKYIYTITKQSQTHIYRHIQRERERERDINGYSKRTNQERRLGHCSVAWRRGLEPELEVPARRCHRRS